MIITGSRNSLTNYNGQPKVMPDLLYRLKNYLRHRDSGLTWMTSEAMITEPSFL